jgi:hypothetical protein
MKRNEKCYCGSGLKFKRCCLLKQQEFERQQLTQQRQEYMMKQIEKLQKNAPKSSVKKETGLKAVGAGSAEVSKCGFSGFKRDNGFIHVPFVINGIEAVL